MPSRRERKGQRRDKPEKPETAPIITTTVSKAKGSKRKTMIAVAAVAIILIAAFLVVGQSVLFSTPSASPSPSTSPTPTPTPFPIPTFTPLASPENEYSSGGTIILLETSMGNIVVQMRDDKPITTQNFINLVKQGFYDGTIFHRVIKDFMIQGGQNQTVTVNSIADEIGNDNRNIVGSIAMAKTSQPNSATSQFFINVVDNGNDTIDTNGTKFDAVYTVFGQVIGGMDTVMQISKVIVVQNQVGEASQPMTPVTLIRATVMS